MLLLGLGILAALAAAAIVHRLARRMRARSVGRALARAHRGAADRHEAELLREGLRWALRTQLVALAGVTGGGCDCAAHALAAVQRCTRIREHVDVTVVQARHTSVEVDALRVLAWCGEAQLAAQRWWQRAGAGAVLVSADGLLPPAPPAKAVN